MTIIKQTGVQSSGHMKNLRGYINDDRKVILRDSLNMDGCTNPKRSRRLPCSDGSNNGS